MRLEVCLCRELEMAKEKLKHSQTHVVILMHHREQHLTTNTARLANLCLPHCQIRMRGLPDHPLNSEGIIDSLRHPLLLYPSEGATVLSEDFVASIKKPITLIVPDGSWRQASKVAKRETFLKNVQNVTLPLGPESRYQLRREPKVGGLATVEAISRALRFTDGIATQKILENLFLEMVRRTILTREGMSFVGEPVNRHEL